MSSSTELKHPRPMGTDIATHFDVSKAKDVEAAARCALTAIGRVHGDGAQPMIPIQPSRRIVPRGVYTPQGGKTVPQGIRIKVTGTTQAFDVVHEVFHALDHRVWGYRNLYGTEADTGGQRFTAIKALVAESRPIKQLEARKKTQRAYVSVPGRPGEPGHRALVEVDQGLLTYLTNPSESLARAYAQYIATRSGDSQLLLELTRIRGRSIHTVYPEQWSDEEFEVIAGAFDRLFEDEKWLALK